MIQQLFSKPLLCKTYGFGIVFIWLSGSLNDINVLQRSHIFSQLVSDNAPSYNYTVNDYEYNNGYFLRMAFI
jgi:hypothetical protein